ncbi:leucyl/phenylalanyl-tRNA--protein transferase [Motilimonas pumila]|uniref:Leucyl/phenylalanyl-tRNA--protein transferase n=1 Tax=Motilimonas pumila TaxID=2303987 RepID=A0A418YGC6_9GAMM|nr:leucyl/phenylalanyl-tRNA--protein transferase [Motilimonas pumila]RJG48722.1 leucyl/phenylalanyl-tRNA--protein transferase [Motilimonas pumila]
MSLFITELTDDAQDFPHPAHALAEPDGLLAVGGDLSVSRLKQAYQNGIFPWFDASQPILWWSPSERAIIAPERVHVGRTMRKHIKRQQVAITVNLDFTQVIEACAHTQRRGEGTWITPQMVQAYIDLHHAGMAHSIECWHQNQLVGGLYGVAVGQLFCGESMFHHQTNASKLAFIGLCQHFSRHGGQLIDCQLDNPHLQTLGVKDVSRPQFLKQLAQLKQQEVTKECWNKQMISVT